MIRVQREDFDPGAELASLTAGNRAIGGAVSFVGLVRDMVGQTLKAMTLEHYPGMAEEEIARHAADAQARWPLSGLTVIHRFGRMTPGDNIVLVVTASAHREAAFEAAQFMMDYLKTHAPFWKREERAAGDNWVEARDQDDAAAARWSQPAKR